MCACRRSAVKNRSVPRRKLGRVTCFTLERCARLLKEKSGQPSGNVPVFGIGTGLLTIIM